MSKAKIERTNYKTLSEIFIDRFIFPVYVDTTRTNLGISEEEYRDSLTLISKHRRKGFKKSFLKWEKEVLTTLSPLLANNIEFRRKVADKLIRETDFINEFMKDYKEPSVKDIRKLEIFKGRRPTAKELSLMTLEIGSMWSYKEYSRKEEVPRINIKVVANYRDYISFIDTNGFRVSLLKSDLFLCKSEDLRRL